MGLIGLKAQLDLSEFNSQVAQYVASMQQITQQTVKASGSAGAASGATTLVDLFGSAWNRVKTILSGVIVIDVWRTLSKGIQSVVKEAVTAVDSFQRLQVQFQGLIARDLSRQLGVPLAETLGQVSGKAKELLYWVRQVAVTTPFSMETLSSALAYGQAFGFTIEQAKRLTIATGEFTAGMGLTNENLLRIIYNFGQMLASGRVLGRELRDLANNFVPVQDIIASMAKKANVSFNQMRDDMKNGKISAADFIATFTEMAEKGFGGAMERMAKTIGGVMQNIHDFIHTVLGMEVLGPVFVNIASAANDMIGKAFQPDVLKFFTAAGLALNNAFLMILATIQNSLSPALTELAAAFGLGTPTALTAAKAILVIGIAIRTVVKVIAAGVRGISSFLDNLASLFGTTFSGLIQKAFEWGSGLILAFSRGMAAAITAVFHVIQAVAQAIAGLLEAHSPPRMLPKLDWWGAKAMQSYINGWKNADFSVFNDIANTVAGYIRALSAKIPEEQIIPRILGSRTAIAALVDQIRKTGSYTAEALNKIFKAAGIASDSLRDYIKQLAEFARVSLQASEAQKVLDFDVDLAVPKKIFGQIVTSVEDLRKVSQNFTGELRTRVMAYVSALEEFQQANKDVEKTQRKLDETTAMYDKRLKDLNDQLTQVTEVEDENVKMNQIKAALASGLLTAEERHRLELELQAIQIKKNIRETEKEKDAAVGSLEIQLKAQEELRSAAEKSMSFQLEFARSIAEEQMAAAQDQLDAAKALVDVQTENNQLMSQQLELLKRIAEQKKAGGGADAGGGLDDSFFEGLKEDITKSMEDVSATMQKAVDDLQAKLLGQWENFVDELTAPFKTPDFQNLGASISFVFSSIGIALSDFRKFWEDNAGTIAGVVENFFTRLGEATGIDFSGILDFLSSFTSGDTGFSDMLTGLAVNIQKFGDSLATQGPIILENIQSWVDWLFDVGVPKLKEAWDWFTTEAIPGIQNFVDTVVTKATEFLTALVPWIPVILSVAASVGILMGTLKLLPSMDYIIAIVVSLSRNFGEAAGLLKLLLGPLAGVIGTILAIGAVIGGLVAVIQSNFLGIRDFIVAAWGSIMDMLGPSIEDLKKSFEGIGPIAKVLLASLQPLFAFLKGVAGVVLVALGVAITVVAGIIAAVIKGIITGLTMFFTYFQKVLMGMTVLFDGIKNFFSGLWAIIKGMFTGISDVDLAAAFQQMLHGLGEIVYGALYAVAGIFATVFATILGFLGGFVEGVIQFFVGLWDRLVGHSIIPDMLKSIYDSFVKWLTDALNWVVTWVGTLVQNIVNFVSKFLAAGVALIQAVWDGIKSLAESVYATVTLIITTGRDKIIEKVKEWLDAGKALLQGVIDGINGMLENVILAVKLFMADVKEKGFAQALKDFITSGEELIGGIIKGLWNKAVELTTALIKIAGDAIAAFLKKMGIGSPSKVFASAGTQMMEGLVLGITKSLPKVKNTLLDAAGEMGKSVSGYLSKNGIMANSNLTISQSPFFRPSTSFGAGTTNLDRSVTVNVNAMYANRASEASIKYDISAALAAAGVFA